MLSKNIQNFFHFVGVAAHPFVQIPHNMGTAIVRLSGLGGMALDMTVLKQGHTGTVQIRTPVRKNAQWAMIFPVEGKHFPGGFRGQTMTLQQNRFMGRTLGASE